MQTHSTSMTIFAVMTEKAPPTASRARGSNFESSSRPRGGEKLQTLQVKGNICHLVHQKSKVMYIYSPVAQIIQHILQPIWSSSC